MIYVQSPTDTDMDRKLGTQGKSIISEPWPLDDIRILGYQIAMAIGAMHEKGIIHNNIYGGAILLNRNNSPMLGGFECGMFEDKDKSDKLFTKIGVCNPFVASPEYVKMISCAGSPEDYGRTSDWFSYGVLLYAMAVGKSTFFLTDVMGPFSFTANAGNVKEAYCRAKPKTLNTKVIKRRIQDKQLRDLILQLLEFDPAKRLGSYNSIKSKTGGGYKEILCHPFFNTVPLEAIVNDAQKWLEFQNTPVSLADASAIDKVTEDDELYPYADQFKNKDAPRRGQLGFAGKATRFGDGDDVNEEDTKTRDSVPGEYNDREGARLDAEDAKEKAALKKKGPKKQAKAAKKAAQKKFDKSMEGKAAKEAKQDARYAKKKAAEKANDDIVDMSEDGATGAPPTEGGDGGEN